jgi:hypothetical protein
MKNCNGPIEPATFWLLAQCTGTDAIIFFSGTFPSLAGWKCRRYMRGKYGSWISVWPTKKYKKCNTAMRHTHRHFRYIGLPSYFPPDCQSTRPTYPFHERYNRFRLQYLANPSRHDVTCPLRACRWLWYTMTSQSHYNAQSPTIRFEEKYIICSMLLLRLGFKWHLL